MGAFQVGDLVQFSRAFLRNTGQTTGNLPFQGGEVTKIVPCGSQEIIYFNGCFEDEPCKALACNLEIARPANRWQDD
jgi:hypothetical protein